MDGSKREYVSNRRQLVVFSAFDVDADGAR